MRDFALGLAFAILGAAIIAIAKDFPTVGNLEYGASLFPVITGSGMLACGALLAARNALPALRALRGAGAAPLRPHLGRLARLALPCVLVVLYIYGNERIGSAPAMFLLMLVLFRAGAVRWRVALPVSLGAAVVIYLAFTRLLAVPLPAGLLGF
ncbi:tripartite tricarboxylate transporter TctB family protein [Orrella sp. JC864]|uniref:tripartite tricarboxylate transporter TctB family protein n=1 Tax=Orrella sp. JC864 TaxID=3120298 RepID=UPI0030090049